VGEITRVLRGLEANAKGRAKGESGRGIVTNVTGVEDAASTNEGEGTVYVETGGAGYCIRWRAEEAGKAAEGVVGGGADRERVDSEPENAVVVAEARGQAEHRVEQEGQRQQKRGQKRKAPENAAAGIVDRESDQRRMGDRRGLAQVRGLSSSASRRGSARSNVRRHKWRRRRGSRRSRRRRGRTRKTKRLATEGRRSRKLCTWSWEVT
jgi:hypothetical protein